MTSENASAKKAVKKASGKADGASAAKTKAAPAKKTSAKAKAPVGKVAAKKAPAKPVIGHTDRKFDRRITDLDLYLFGQGTHYDIYRKLGAHPTEIDGVQGVYFAVWAPNAVSVFVVGDFNGWTDAHPMKKLGEIGIWDLFIPGLGEGELYKYLIVDSKGLSHYKADPYANYAELRPGTASRTTDLTSFTWKDEKWEEAKRNADPIHSPMAIYECHVGSWMRHPDGRGGDGFYTYREFADRIVGYLKDMPFTHVELMGICEHPFDGSWGYQVTGYYAPTSRYGTPQDFMYMIDLLHRNGIGVILDWVPAHFCPDEHGLAEFDGSCIYEDADPRRGQHPDWGTRIFNLSRNEVKNFLIGNVFYWMREFHVDGIRVDAVASMLYLDYGRKDGEWLPNKYGGHENLDSIEFFKHLNSVVRGENPGFITVAEESTAWPKITGAPEDGGLGFTFKWNMGWMHDFCEYMKLDPVMRKGAHHLMTFAMSYNDAENYILPLSHDEVVHLKCSMVEKMPGYTVDKYANLRAGYTYMLGHSGKKLLFMGQEFGQEREWSEARELDWFLLASELNSGMQRYVGELLAIYRHYPALYKADDSWEGFEWLDANDADRSIYSFIRRAPGEDKQLLFILNMTPMERPFYWAGTEKDARLKLLLNSARVCYGNPEEKEVPETLKPVEGECNGHDYHVELTLPPYAALIYEMRTVKPRK